MTVLCDYQIRHYAEEWGMITPFLPSKHGDFATWGLSSFGYDIRLGQEVGGWDPDEVFDLDPAANLQQHLRTRELSEGTTFALGPNRFILAHSVEYLKMPKDVVGLVKDKSTYARLGLAVQNTVLEPGWEGQITLELSNHSNHSIMLHTGRGIAQVMFFRGMPPGATYGIEGTYQHQRGVTPPRRKK